MSCNRTAIRSTQPSTHIGCPDIEAFWAANLNLVCFCPACRHFLRRDGGCTHCESQAGTGEFPNAFDITTRLKQAGFQAVVVGGFLRKALSGLLPKDIDIATSATPDEVRAVFGSRVRSNKGESHGTLLVLPPDGQGEPIEVTTFRLDVETDGRRATTAFTRDIIEDLKRRDITPNAIAVDPHSGEVFGPGPGGDPTDALADVRNGVIRFVGGGRVRHQRRPAARAKRTSGYLTRWHRLTP